MSPPQAGRGMELRLYVAGSAPNSVRAVANLDEICRMYLAPGYRLEIIDVLDEPLRAIEDGVLVTPTLLRMVPQPVRRIIGNLGDRAQVLTALGVTPDSEGSRG